MVFGCSEITIYYLLFLNIIINIKNFLDILYAGCPVKLLLFTEKTTKLIFHIYDYGN